MYKGNRRESVLKEVWWVVHIMREAKVVGVRVWIMTNDTLGHKEVTGRLVTGSRNQEFWE